MGSFMNFTPLYIQWDLEVFGFIKERRSYGVEKMYLLCAPQPYDFVVQTSLTHPRKGLLVVL
jgi:hypothetical protein